MSLFSVFDPVSYFGFSLNWVVVLLVVTVFSFSYWNFGGLSMEVFGKFEDSMQLMFKDISFPYGEGLVMISMVMFIFLSVLNLAGLFPYVFCSTGHVVVTFSVGFLMWMMSFLMGWLKSFSESSCHLVPEGSPLILAPFMVIIESVSQVIRPVTLSVRLAANMMAGHLIIGLISSISLVSFSVYWVSVVLQVMMLILEWAVCFIQAFVFSVLVMLYSLDYYYW